MNCAELIAHYSQHVRDTLLDHVNLGRVAELADRGDTAEIGRVFAHALDAAKHAAEQQLAEALVSDDELTMLRKQAD